MDKICSALLVLFLEQEKVYFLLDVGMLLTLTLDTDRPFRCRTECELLGLLLLRCCI